MKVVSVNTGMPETVVWNGREVLTGIFKSARAGAVRVTAGGMEGDGQADLTVHGGTSKAVYAYPAEHYAFWRGAYPDMEFPWGTFGENLTVEGLDESVLRVGDRLRIGTAECIVTEPRMPCFKLGLRFGRMDVVKRFLESGKPGFYLAVLSPGEVAAGDPIVPLARDPNRVTVNDVVHLHRNIRAPGEDGFEAMRRAVRVEALPDSWRDSFRIRLEEGSGEADAG